MREITQGDIRAAARVLIARPCADWPALVTRMLDEAHHADCHRKALGRLHGRLGNGTLMAVAMRHGPAPEPLASDRAYLDAMAAVIAAVICWRAERASRR